MDELNVALVITQEQGRPRCSIRGEIDMATAPTVGKALASFIEIGETAIDLDLSEVDFLDSRGITELVIAHRHGLRISIVAASPAVKRTLDIAGIDGLLEH